MQREADKLKWDWKYAAGIMTLVGVLVVSGVLISGKVQQDRAVLISQRFMDGWASGRWPTFKQDFAGPRLDLKEWTASWQQQKAELTAQAKSDGILPATGLLPGRYEGVREQDGIWFVGYNLHDVYQVTCAIVQGKFANETVSAGRNLKVFESLADLSRIASKAAPVEQRDRGWLNTLIKTVAKHPSPSALLTLRRAYVDFKAIQAAYQRVPTTAATRPIKTQYRAMLQDEITITEALALAEGKPTKANVAMAGAAVIQAGQDYNAREQALSKALAMAAANEKGSAGK